ncbi:plasmid segregation protein ParM [Paenibacillus sp. UNC496MF]|uniref:ParM/StbA family protein n=1 Tax=Paenibacillus sp. UNC496MF TaxID=1502753 RepID=UPI0008DFDDFD|nr:ParM/StbA family protein [Paenibacillus sp. UNC496MF]SFJ77191.1 plasmid segregation protein ParM [Paenibacillus sp. UNC496MF]
MKLKLHSNAGFDFGNSELDAYVNGVLIAQPNVFAVAGKNPWSDDDLDVKKNLSNIYDNMVVSIISGAVRTNMYAVGRHALKTYGENVTSLYVKGNNAKSDQEVPYVSSLAVLAAQAVEEANRSGANVNEIELTVDMATALPVKQHMPTNIDTMKKKFMDDTHTVSVHLGLTKKVDVKIKFEYVHILQEGTPPVFALQMDQNGDWRTGGYNPASNENDLFTEFAKIYDLPADTDGSYLDGKNLLHVDLGDGTLDDPFTRGDSVDKDFCSGVNHGVGHAIADSIDDLLDLAPHVFNSLSRQQYSDILRSQYSGRKHKFLPEALSAFRPHCENQVNQILKHIADQILKIGANEIDIVPVYGGGSILMRDYLEPKLKQLCDDSRIQLFYVPAKYAVTLNAEGLDFFVHSDIYKALKSQAVTVAAPIAEKTKKQIAAAKEQ